MNNDLIFRSLSGQTTEEEENRLTLWRREDEENDRRYHEVAELLRLIEERFEPPMVDAPPSGARLIELAAARASDRADHRRASQRRLAVASMGMAAAAVIAFALGGLLRTSPQDLKLIEAQTGASETVMLGLDDGSAVRLGPDSRLQILDTRDSREVQLEGQGFFSIARNDALPFRVRTAHGEVEVLGTRFEVRVTEEKMRLVVVEGSVALQTVRGEALRITRDHVAYTDQHAESRVVALDDAYALLDWMADAAVFQDTPLARVADELARRYGVRIEILSDELAERTVTARQTGSSLEETLAVICMVVGARCSAESGTVTIAP